MQIKMDQVLIVVSYSRETQNSAGVHSKDY